MFVVRTGRPALEIIRVDKESTANGQQGNNDADSQENILLDSCQYSYNLGITRNLNLKSTDLEEN